MKSEELNKVKEIIVRKLGSEASWDMLGTVLELLEMEFREDLK